MLNVYSLNERLIKVVYDTTWFTFQSCKRCIEKTNKLQLVSRRRPKKNANRKPLNCFTDEKKYRSSNYGMLLRLLLFFFWNCKFTRAYTAHLFTYEKSVWIQTINLTRTWIRSNENESEANKNKITKQFYNRDIGKLEIQPRKTKISCVELVRSCFVRIFSVVANLYSYGMVTVTDSVPT